MAELTARCGDCGGSVRVEISQSVIHGGIEWSIHRACGGCGREAYECGRGDLPEGARAALVEQCGLTRVRAGGGVPGAARLKVMRVFRDGGAGLAEAAGAVERLAGEGLTGTRAEMELLAGRLRAAGAPVSLGPA
ncbi:hypothetical protein Daura_13145 [Dactylosporangium aurantiacum]|uniref:Uncharacterized protein n=1 Tax=Dactylosporangium aurantiacum TaxID=35754 RepID=A0A9Q9MFB4_9ACTN|nr:hypothetical protein [Dactylosporangium aurantiacum]MDG6105644.1 hypothetical protein [Dactylosporangium aurantiacum]UWZ57023.1 hypothetical protein Daura_13145 [Dactylosporangium aurantiacum]